MTVWVTHITAHPLALKFLLPTSPHRFCRLRLPPSPSPTWTFSLISPTGCPPLCNQQTFKPSRTSPTCQRIFPTSCYSPSRPDVRQTLLYREVSSPAQARPTYSLNFWSLTSACKISFAIQETIALRRPRPPSIAFCRPQPRDSTLSWLRPWHNESSLPAGRCHGTSRSACHCHKTPRSIGHCRGSSSAGSPSATDHRLRPRRHNRETSPPRRPQRELSLSSGCCHGTSRSTGYCRGTSSAGSPPATDYRLRPLRPNCGTSPPPATATGHRAPPTTASAGPSPVINHRATPPSLRPQS